MTPTTDDFIVDFIHRFPLVPMHTIGGLTRYWKDHCPVGDFLIAVLSNNLIEACCRADHHNLPAIQEICKFVYNEMPSESHGSLEKMEKWLCDGV